MHQEHRPTRRSALKVIVSWAVAAFGQGAGGGVQLVDGALLSMASATSARALIGWTSRVFSPSKPRSASHDVGLVEYGEQAATGGAAVVSCSRPGRTSETHSGRPYEAVITLDVAAVVRRRAGRGGAESSPT
jgi:hypothetical protein